MSTAAVQAVREELGLGPAATPAAAVLAGLRTAVDALDPAQAPAGDAVELVRVLDRIERVAATAKAAAASRVAQTELWRRGGHRSPAHWLARETGVGITEAGRLLDTVRATAPAPPVEDAVRAGSMSARQGRAIGPAVAADPAAGRELMDRADQLSVTELETEATRIVTAASAETDAERARRHHRRRSLRTGTTPDGMGWGRWELPLPEHARLLARIDTGREAAFRAARRTRQREPVEAYAADGLVALADTSDHHPGAGPVGEGGQAPGSSEASEVSEASKASTPPPARPGRSGRWGDAKVVVRIDLTALDRGRTTPGEVSEIAGLGPLPVPHVWDVIDGGALVAAVTTRGTRIDQVVHLGRHPTALQRTALQWATAGTCAVRGCDATARLEIDHVADWAATHQTRLDQLAAVCGHHHDLKTHHGFRFGPPDATGARPLLPPAAGRRDPADGGAPPPARGHPPPDPPPDGSPSDPAQPGLFDDG